MSRPLFTALRTGIALTFLGTLLGQIVVIPWIATDEASTAPEVAHVRWPYTVAGIATLICLQVALVAIWRLMTRVQRDEVFDEAALTWVNAIITAALVATLLVAGTAAHLLFVIGVGGPGIILVLAGALVCGSSFALLMAVMRGLLQRATSMRGELAEVV